MDKHFGQRREVELYMEHAHRMLVVAAHNLDNNFYASAVNRAYYAIFYAANATLTTKGITRSKHSGVISAFRLHFVKTGVFEVEYSRIYGRAMDDRHLSDYEIYETLTVEQVRADLDGARRFVERVGTYLKREGWL